MAGSDKYFGTLSDLRTSNGAASRHRKFNSWYGI